MVEKLKSFFLLVIGFFFIIGCFLIFLQKPAPTNYQDNWAIKVNKEIIPVEVADSDRERVRGLSGRSTLQQGTGLLFIFPQAEIQGFWMKEMLFPIDIVWINEDWTVAGVERGILPESFPLIFYSPEPVKYVWELNSGEAARLGIDSGVKLFFTRKN